MAKKVLILSSSPRRGGNSDTLCDEFMRGAAKKVGDYIQLCTIYIKQKPDND